MSSAFRLGLLSRPAAAATSHLLRPLPAHTTRPTIPRSPAAAAPAPARAYANAAEFRTAKTGLPRQGTPTDHPDLPIPKPSARDVHIPPYPYGPRRVYKQSNYGLYGNGRIRFGNNVSPKHNVKTPRVWRPNVQRKRLWSFALGCWVQTRLTMRVLRTIDKAGGLDGYLLGDKPMRIKELGPWGWKLRWRVMQSPLIKKKFRDERAALGLPPRTDEEFDEELDREMQGVDAVDLEDTGADDLPMWPEGPEDELDAETEHATGSSQNLPLLPLANEGMPFESEAPDADVAKDEGVVDEAAPEPETTKDEGFMTKTTPRVEVAKDEGFMKEAKP